MVADQTVRLNQLIAVRKGVRSTASAKLIRLNGDLQKAVLLSGISRTYRKINDLDPDLPGESTRVQRMVGKGLLEMRDVMTRLFDVTAAVDWTNAVASADVVVDGQVLIAGAPVPFLLFLEKQIVEIRNFVSNLPVLDPAEKWVWSDDAAAWAAGPATTTRTQKVMRNHVLAEATDKHPAQVQPYQEDVIVGYWDTMKFSGAVPASRRGELLDRITELSDGVKFAREQANMTEVHDPNPAAPLFTWLLRS